VTVDKNEADLALHILREADEAAYILGDVRTSSKSLTLC
jgi:hypothetical protein